jgi:outer membrane protein assembly factor BamB
MRSLPRPVVAGLSLLFLGVLTARGDDWPQWLGPTRDGVYAETGVIDTIPEKGLPIKWRVPVSGGYSGPAVADGRVFVTDYLRKAGDAFNNPNERANLQGRERVLCFDAQTGKPLWENSYDCPYSISYPAGPRCTPTVDADRVYTLGSEGDLLCLATTDGKLLWERSFPRDLDAEVPIWGFAAHPLVVDDLVICMVGGPGQVVVAFDKRTGEVRWKALNASSVGYCPVSLIEMGGVRQLIVWHADAIESLDPQTGAVYWTMPFAPSYGMAIARPQLDGNRMYASGIHASSLMLELDEDEPQVTELWSGGPKEAVHCANSTPIFRDGTIYGSDCVIGSLIAVRGSDGERLWQSFQPTIPTEDRMAKHGTAFLTRFAGTDRYLIFSEVGDLVIAELTPQGYEEHGRFHVLEPTSEAFGRRVVCSHPAYANRTAFVRNDQELVAVDLSR